MTAAEMQIVYGCIRRIHHLWFDENCESDLFGKITGLFEVVSKLAPYRCCWYVHYLWLAHQAAYEARCWRLARYRMRLFDDGLQHLYEIAQQLPSSVRD